MPVLRAARSGQGVPGPRSGIRPGVWIDVYYKGEKVGRKRVDFIVGDGSGDVMVEIKAKAALEPVDFVQALSHLKADTK